MTCECGCGQVPRTIKGKYRRFVGGHQNRGRCNGKAIRPYESLYKNMLNQARKRSLSAPLTYEDFLSFVGTAHCHYCESLVDWAMYNPNTGERNRYNLDRKDNDVGYEKENLVVCCKRCNYGKGDRFSYEEWVVMTAALKKAKTAAA
jgi:hypothetical protein